MAARKKIMTAKKSGPSIFSGLYGISLLLNWNEGLNDNLSLKITHFDRRATGMPEKELLGIIVSYDIMHKQNKLFSLDKINKPTKQSVIL